MTENTQHRSDRARETAAIAADVDLELGRVDALGEESAQTLAGLAQDPVETPYYAAALRSLRSSLPFEDLRSE